MVKKQLLKIWLITLLTSSISTFILVHLIETYRIINFKCYMPYFTELMCAFISVILTFSFLPLFFNLKKHIAKNRNLNFLSFFLLPIIAVVSMSISTLIYYENSSDLKYLFAIIIPFLITICFFYFKFRALINKNNQDLDLR